MNDIFKILLQEEHTAKVIQGFQSFELLVEYFIKPKEANLYRTFTIVEIAKALIRLRMWLKRDQLQIFISENNVYLQKDQAEDQQVATFEKKFNSLDQDPLPDLNSLSSPNDSTSQLLEDLKKKKPQVFNQGYYETINDKKLAIITTLPIPEQYKRNKEAFRFRIALGELIYILRPIVYCISILYYGLPSYRPFFISLALDFLRYLIQLKPRVSKKSQKEELNLRLKEAILNYLLRDPFYSDILKQRIILRILHLLFKPDAWMVRIIISLIELRSSKALLI